MKNNSYIRQFFCYIFIFVTTASFAQKSPILGSFSISENKETVFLNWQIVAGSNCNGIQIWRSLDSLYFTQIGFIPGICGNISTPQDFSFTDRNPVKNKINYYRLELGNTGPSEILSIEIIDIENGYQIRPNPVSDFAKIYFYNNTNHLFQLTIFNLNGAEILRTETKKDFFELSAQGIPSGIYLFTIGTAGSLPKAKGKIIVQH